VSVSTPHGSQGTQAYKGDDVVSGGLPQTRRATFRVSGRPGRLTVAGAIASNRPKTSRRRGVCVREREREGGRERETFIDSQR
jgi:hypothetical protein